MQEGAPVSGGCLSHSEAYFGSATVVALISPPLLPPS